MKKIIEHLTEFSREFLIISLSLLLLITTITDYQKKIKYRVQSMEYNQIKYVADSLKSLNDSLTTDNIMMDMELHRHEMTREEIFLKYPKVGEEYEYFLGHYTE